MTDTLYWLWLAMACGAASGAWGKLRTVFSSAEDVFMADPDTILSLISRNRKAASGLLDHRLGDVRRMDEYCSLHNIGIIGYDSALYPDTLRKIDSPPPLLFVRGTLPDSSLLHIGVVGTRRISDEGALICYSFSHSLARCGTVIVSGMALGTDSIAHASALEVGTPTVAVVGCGLDCVYPPCHRHLFDEICYTGAVISEYPPGEGPATYHFPARNRIISALSSALLVIEGAPDSGSMITADHAFRQGKPVYVPDTPCDSDQRKGNDALLLSGARAVSDASAILCDLGIKSEETGFNPCKADLTALTDKYGVSFAETGEEKKQKATGQQNIERPVPKPGTDTLYRLDAFTISVYQAIPEYVSCRLDDIVSEKMPACDVMRSLTLLEFAHLIVRHPSGRISRT